MFSAIPIQSLRPNPSQPNAPIIDVLRLDKLHTIVSGNKWFKLKYYLQAAKENNRQTIATFGGAYSNHIVATAFAAKMYGFKSIGIIRAEQPDQLSHTLKNARQFGMDLQFVSREKYRDKAQIMQQDTSAFWIDEGGYGLLGAKGIGEIYTSAPLWQYTHLVVAVGTGTTMAGIIQKAHPYQKVIGVSVLKNNLALIEQINALLSDQEKQKDFELLQDFHFGGYAKKTNTLIEFMNEAYQSVNLPLDFVYTAKAFYALHQLIKEQKIKQEDRPLFIHTGGLQGNLSLPAGLLDF